MIVGWSNLEVICSIRYVFTNLLNYGSYGFKLVTIEKSLSSSHIHDAHRTRLQYHPGRQMNLAGIICRKFSQEEKISVPNSDDRSF